MKHDASSQAFETSKELTGAGSSGWRTFQARVADPVHPDLEGLASGNDCVVKLLRQPDAERIWHDARLLAALPRHPHVVQYYGAILEHRRAGDAVLVASEWCTEGSLLDLLDDGLESARGTKRASDGCIALDVAVEFFIHVCAGLHFLHVDVLLAHGNLRPANILITRTNAASRLQAKLSDVGLADLAAIPASAPVLPDAYLAPERAGARDGGAGRGAARGPSAPADIFAAGIVLVDLLAPVDSALPAALADPAPVQAAARAVAARLVRACSCGNVKGTTASSGCIACELATWLPRLLARKADARPTAGEVGDALLLSRGRSRMCAPWPDNSFETSSLIMTLFPSRGDLCLLSTQTCRVGRSDLRATAFSGEGSQDVWAARRVPPPPPLHIARARHEAADSETSKALNAHAAGGWAWADLAAMGEPRGNNVGAANGQAVAESSNGTQQGRKSLVPDSEVLSGKWSWPTRHRPPPPRGLRTSAGVCARPSNGARGESASIGRSVRSSLAERYQRARGPLRVRPGEEEVGGETQVLDVTGQEESLQGGGVVEAVQDGTASSGVGAGERAGGTADLEENGEHGIGRIVGNVREYIEGGQGSKLLGAAVSSALGHRVVVVGAPATPRGANGLPIGWSKEGYDQSNHSPIAALAGRQTDRLVANIDGAGEKWLAAEKPILRGSNGTARWLGARIVGAAWQAQGSFTEYVVRSQGGGKRWEVRRRYTDFLNLALSLRSHAAATDLTPLLPPKAFFGSNSAAVVKARKEGLSKYLDALTRLCTGPPPVLVGQDSFEMNGNDQNMAPSSRPLSMEEELLAYTLLAFLDAPPTLKDSPSSAREIRRIKWREQINDEREIERVGRGLKSPRRRRKETQDCDCEGEPEVDAPAAETENDGVPDVFERDIGQLMAPSDKEESGSDVPGSGDVGDLTNFSEWSGFEESASLLDLEDKGAMEIVQTEDHAEAFQTASAEFQDEITLVPDPDAGSGRDAVQMTPAPQAADMVYAAEGSAQDAVQMAPAPQAADMENAESSVQEDYGGADFAMEVGTLGAALAAQAGGGVSGSSPRASVLRLDDNDSEDDWGAYSSRVPMPVVPLFYAAGPKVAGGVDSGEIFEDCVET